MSKLQEARAFKLKDKLYGKERTAREAPVREAEGPKVSRSKVTSKSKKKDGKK